VRRNAFNVNDRCGFLNAIQYPPLSAEPRGTQVREPAGKLLVVESLNGPEPLGSTLTDDGAPESILLRDLKREVVEHLRGVALSV
jgi:hypothetical protein